MGRQGELPWNLTTENTLARIGEILRLKAEPGSPVRMMSVNTTRILADEGDWRGTLVTFDDLTNLERKNAENARSCSPASGASGPRSASRTRNSGPWRQGPFDLLPLIAEPSSGNSSDCGPPWVLTAPRSGAPWWISITSRR